MVAAAAPERPAVSSPGTEIPDRTATLRRGETLGDLLEELGLPVDEVPAVVAAASGHLNPRQLRPGLEVAAYVEAAGPARLEIALDGRGELALARSADGWTPEFRPYRRETRTRVVRGELAGAFESSLVDAGANADLVYAVADVLQWDLDFTRDLHNGDRFEVLFEETYLEGSYFGIGRILALSYEQPKRRYEAFRFGEGESYYDGEGRPLEKMFLRAPLPYSRITSKFSMRRFHPVLKVARPHYGVDYGAPVGTPVRVTASGTVEFAGWDGGGGRTVKVRHSNGYLTGYLHLSRFAEGIRPGVRVRQGDRIGYVGATGLASGPHLDYRVQHNGRWIDPQSLRTVPAEPIGTLARVDFERQRDAMRSALATGVPWNPSAAPPVEPAPSRIAVADGGARTESRSATR
jgi:murein DD-endopeptidase MepM/ murein hydrolase activator NlpD